MQHFTQVFGVTHVDLQCTNLTYTANIYRDTLGFTEINKSLNWLDLDAGGTIILRLQVVDAPIQKTTIRIQVTEVNAFMDTLLACGCKIAYPPEKTPDLKLSAAVSDLDENTIVIWRALSEDEYETTPELPKEMVWTGDAEELLKKLLKGVPSLFRSLARRKIVRTVEELAKDKSIVIREDVIRGYILASPKVTRERNRKPLIEAGIDIEKYRADWDSL